MTKSVKASEIEFYSQSHYVTYACYSPYAVALTFRVSEMGMNQYVLKHTSQRGPLNASIKALSLGFSR